MPKQRKKECIVCPHFVWLIGPRSNDVYYADGRSNTQDLGRHSLNTKDRAAALDALKQLDLTKAAERGLINSSVLQADPAEMLRLDEGRQRYMAHVARPPAIGGVGEATVARYRAIFDKFLPFLQARGVNHWELVTRDLLEAYCTWLYHEDYAMATIYCEATTIKQAIKWLVDRKLIPAECLIRLPVERPADSDTYCYRGAEVEEILKHCWSDPQLHWLARVVLFLCMTGLRISELINLRWSDVDLDANLLRLPDRRRSARKSERATARGTKSGRSRALPLHRDLQRMLESVTRAPDGLILHAPKGGKLDDDKIRKVFIRDVIEPLTQKFPKPAGEKGFADGRLHSFRHYFISVCASNRVDIEVLKKWMGHRDSKMINYYYHLHAEESQKQMKRIQPAGGASAAWRPKIPQNHNPNTRSAPEQNGKNNTEKT